MEEYVTKAEFEQFKRHMEQKTEEMKALRVDVHNVDVEAVKQELHTISNTWLETLQEHYDEHKEAISNVETIQSGHTKFFEEHGKRLTALQNDISELKSMMKQLLQPKSNE
jgi:predicted nuclease with TOPRIM domain